MVIKPITVTELIKELNKVRDKDKIIQMYNRNGNLTANIDVSDEKRYVLIRGGSRVDGLDARG
jgi:hypothetical protein